MPTYEFTETLVISKDKAEREAKTGKSVTVRFLFEDWSTQDLVDRLAVANSPKVSVATVLRNLDNIPTTYTYKVPKAGTRGSAPITPQAVVNSGKTVAELEAFQKELEEQIKAKKAATVIRKPAEQPK